MTAAARFDASGRPTPEALAEERKLQALFPGCRGVDPDYVHAGRDALERWWDWKFGLRIHWSLYSITGNGPESWPLTNPPEGINAAELRAQYEELHKWWNPSRFDADAWCDLMVRAGLKYFTFTTKHHDGFSMYDTKTRVKKRLVHTGPQAGRIVDCDLRYSILDGPFGRDIVRELTDAGRRRGLGIGLYFSHIDWFDADFRIDVWNYQQDPAYTQESDPAGFERMIARHRAQLVELCSNYGKLDLLSLDMGFPGDEELSGGLGLGVGTTHGVRDDLVATIKAVRRLQPEMLIRRRGIDPYGDYCTPERVVPEDPQAPGGGLALPWQVIYPGGRHFSYQWGDEYKPASWIVGNLVDITAKGGCFQVGYGPGPDGTWDASVVGTLEAVGDWLRVNGEGIYATRPHRVYKEGEDIRFTATKDGAYVYAFLMNPSAWPGGPDRVQIESVRAKPGSAITMLGLDHRFDYEQDEKCLVVHLPDWFEDPKNRPCDGVCTLKIAQGE